nr:protein FAR1-related sequence 6 [Tanacetum cinerariifolium]
MVHNKLRRQSLLWRRLSNRSGVLSSEHRYTCYDGDCKINKRLHDNTSLNSQDVETSPIQNDPDTVVPEDVEPSHTQHIPTIPTAGMKFDTEDELYDYFTACAYKVGFGLRRSIVRNELKVVEDTMLLDVIKEGGQDPLISGNISLKVGVVGAHAHMAVTWWSMRNAFLPEAPSIRVCLPSGRAFHPNVPSIRACLPSRRPPSWRAFYPDVPSIRTCLSSGRAFRTCLPSRRPPSGSAFRTCLSSGRAFHPDFHPGLSSNN